MDEKDKKIGELRNLLSLAKNKIEELKTNLQAKDKEIAEIKTSSEKSIYLSMTNLEIKNL